MPPSRRSSRIDLRPPTPSGTPAPALDTAPDLAADDLRRSGGAGLLLLAVGAAVFGLGVGLLGIPFLMGGGNKAEVKRSAKEADAPASAKEAGRANGGASETKASRESPESPESQDASKLYPHQNLLPAGLLVPPPEAKTPESAGAADAAKSETPQTAEAKTTPPDAAASKNEPEPAAKPPESSGPFRLVTFNGFDERKALGWQNGSFQSDPTFKKSPGSWAPEKLGPISFVTLLRAPDIPKEAASGQAVPNFGKRGDGYLLNLQVYSKNLEAIRLDLMDGAGGTLASLPVRGASLKDGEWTELHFELDKAELKRDAKPETPVIGLRLTFLGDKNKKGATAAAIDEASVTVGGSSAEAAKAAAAAREKALAEAEKAAQAEALKQALTGDPGKDGFLLGPEILDTYKRLAPGGDGAAKPKTKAKEIARLVSGGAGSSSFLAPLGAKDGDLKETDGYTWRAAGSAVWRDPAGAAREVERYLADGNPEVLVLAADPEEIVARRKHPYEYFAELSCAVDAAMKRGVLPVLVSPMEDLEGAPEKSEKRARLASVRKLVVELGETRRIPVLDAGALLDEKAFANGRVQPAGYQKLNEAFLKLYRKLERYVLPREGIDRSAAPNAGLPGLPGLPAGPGNPAPKENKPAIGVED